MNDKISLENQLKILQALKKIAEISKILDE